ncbi:MAG: alginate lyase family protein, partial [Bacteroidales bacterium]
MKSYNLLLVTVLFTLITACGNQPETSRLGGWDYDWMKQVKSELNKGETFYLPAYESLIAEADRDLEGGVYSVTFKKMVPPSGSKNDYMSMGPYWWPDPEQPDGLPYIRRDGEVNPE